METPSPGSGYFTALDNISFEVPKGRTLGVIGLNGSGKSTLLQILAGTLRPTSGTVETNGKIAAILELGSGFNPDFTGRENIELNSTILGIQAASGEGDPYEKIIQYADIGGFIDQPVRTYSSGMLIRLAFAVSIHSEPDILIVDEALAVGDGRFQAKCFHSILGLQKQGKTILFVSHDVNTVVQICDHALLLHHGNLRSEGDPGAVSNDYSKVLTDMELPDYTFYPTKEKGEVVPVENLTDEEVILRDERKTEASGGSEVNYGGERGVIEDFVIAAEDGGSATILHSGKTYNMSFTGRAYVPLKSPIFALTIRNEKRQEIFGTNTLFAKVPTPDMRPGESVRVTFKLQANICPGIYFVSLGFTLLEKGAIHVVHRRYDIVELLVQANDGAFGIANCHTRIELSGA